MRRPIFSTILYLLKQGICTLLSMASLALVKVNAVAFLIIKTHVLCEIFCLDLYPKLCLTAFVTISFKIFCYIALTLFISDVAPRLAAWFAAKVMHDVMLHGVVRAPLSFHDVTPQGRILSRFSKDVDVMDNLLPQQIADTLWCMFEVYQISVKGAPRMIWL